MQNAVTIDHERVKQIAKIVRTLPDSFDGLNFHSFPNKAGEMVVAKDMYPTLDHPQTIDFFFFVILHQHGFWYGNDRGYDVPLYGSIRQEKMRGGTLVFKALMRLFVVDPRVVTPEWLSPFSPQKFATLFSDDNGPIPFPDWEARYILTKRYLDWLNETNITPSDIVQVANDSKSSLQQFRRSLKMVPGFKDDHFEKKTILLAMALSSRPERYLRVNDPEYWIPAVDYHYMRFALRAGMVIVHNTFLVDYLKTRRWVNAKEEHAIREKTYEVAQIVRELSGKSIAAIDYLFWNAGRFCPEWRIPDCEQCKFNSVCPKEIEYFQPVFRTLHY